MFQRISPAQAKQLIAEEAAQVIDIRDVGSFQMGHIPNSTCIDNSNIGEYMTQADVEKPLIVCCYHGNSSQSAAAYMAEQGFKKSYSLDGGFELWQATYPDHLSR